MVRKIQAKLVLAFAMPRVCRGVRSRGRKACRAGAFPMCSMRRGPSASAGMMSPARPTARCTPCCFPVGSERESVYEQPDWARVHRELARVGVTLRILHGEYADGCRRTGKPHMGYDRFCKLYAAYVQKLGVTSRVEHKAGPHHRGRLGRQDLADRGIRSPGIRQRRICSWPCCRSAGTRSWNPRSTWRRTRGCGPTWRCTSGSAVPRPAWCATI